MQAMLTINTRVEVTVELLCVAGQGGGKSPMDWIMEAPPIKVSGTVVASYGSKPPCFIVSALQVCHLINVISDLVQLLDDAATGQNERLVALRHNFCEGLT